MALPVLAISRDPPLASEALSADQLRAYFRDPRPWHTEPNDERLVRAIRRELVAAAVLIPLVVHEQGMTVLLTQRTDHLSDHAGQVSFPGGRTEAADGSPVETALRETEEEIGLSRERIETIGSLPEYVTGTGYRISPVVALVRPPFSVRADPFEVAEVFEVPLNFLMDPANHQTRRAVLDTGERLFFAMPYERHFIWGATAAMLRNLYRFLAAQIAP
jgi:8-oxo-dGTP pyrophosphatase MutT (NUDIX family)